MVGTIIGGGTPSTSIKEYWDNGEIVWITPAYMSSLTSNYISNSYKKITKLGLDKSSAKLMPKGSIIMSSRAPIGYIGINTVEACTSQGCKSLVPFILETNHFLFLTIKSSISRIIEASKGTTFNEISGTKFGEILIPLAPLKEQNKICRRIDTLYKSMEEIKNNVESIQADVKILKQKILDYFFGLGSSYKSYYSNRQTKKLKDIIPTDKVGDGDWVLSENMDNHGEYSLVQLKHIGKGEFLHKSFQHVNEEFFRSNVCTEIKENFILINRLISNEMNVCLLPKFDFKCITAVDVCWIAPSKEYNQKYLLYYFMSPEFQKEVQHLSSGTTRKRISKTNLLNIKVSIHELDEQQNIVAEIDNLFSKIDAIYS